VFVIIFLFGSDRYETEIIINANGKVQVQIPTRS